MMVLIYTGQDLQVVIMMMRLLMVLKLENRAVPSGSFSGSYMYWNIHGSTFDLTQRSTELMTFVWSHIWCWKILLLIMVASGDKIEV